MKEMPGNVEISIFFFDELYVLEVPENDLMVVRICLPVTLSVSLCACDKKFIDALPKALMLGILQYFRFS